MSSLLAVISYSVHSINDGNVWTVNIISPIDDVLLNCFRFEVAEPVKDAPKTSGKYVPPAMRKAQSEAPAVTVSSGTSKYGARGKKTAPDVNSQEDFPTLGSVGEPK